MPTRLGSLDIAIVVLYVLGTTLVGIWFTRRQHDLRTYFVGDRDVAWWLVLISIVTTETSVVTFLSVPGLSFAAGGNMTYLQLALGYIVGRILIAWLLLPMYFRGALYSAYQVLLLRFGPAVQRTASLLFLMTRTVADGLRLYLAGQLLNTCTRWPLDTCIVAMAGITVIYTFLGGMKAVIWTDVVQFALKIGGGVVALLVILATLPDGWTGFVESGKAAGKFQVLNIDFDFTERFTLWAGLIGGAFFSMASHGADQMTVQRYLCSRSLGSARLALVLSGLLVTLQFVLFLLIGIGLAAQVEAGLLTLDPGTTDDQVFGQFIVDKLPIGLIGLVIAAVLAAAMSTLSSSLNSSASAMMADFYKPLRPGYPEGHYLVISRGLTILAGAAQTMVALAAPRFQERSTIQNVLAVAGFSTGMVLGLFFLGRMRRAVAPAAALGGLIGGFAAVLAVWLPPRLADWGLAGLDESLSAWLPPLLIKPGLAWPWYAPIGTTVTVVVALLADKLVQKHGSSADRGSQSGLGATG